MKIQSNSSNSLLIEIADLYGLLGAILNNSPDETTVKNLRACFLDNSNDLPEEMALFWSERANVSDAEIARELAIEWTRLFRGLSIQLGPPPPYTGVYISEDGTGIEIISAVKKAYRTEGLINNGKYQDRADYLGFELEFMAHLAKLAADAYDNNEPEKADEYRKKLNNFTEKFVSPWIDEFIDKALAYAQTSFFKGYLKLLGEAAQPIYEHFDSIEFR